MTDDKDVKKHVLVIINNTVKSDKFLNLFPHL